MASCSSSRMRRNPCPILAESSPCFGRCTWDSGPKSGRKCWMHRWRGAFLLLCPRHLEMVRTKTEVLLGALLRVLSWRQRSLAPLEAEYLVLLSFFSHFDALAALWKSRHQAGRRQDLARYEKLVSLVSRRFLTPYWESGSE